MKVQSRFIQEIHDRLKWSRSLLSTCRKITTPNAIIPVVGRAHHRHGPQSSSCSLGLHSQCHQGRTLSYLNIPQVRYFSCVRNKSYLTVIKQDCKNALVSFTSNFDFNVFPCLLVWKSVKPCAPGWPSWWTAGSDVWAVSNIWKTGNKIKTIKK